MEYVDLGLPSGKKWAKCNLGATSEEEYGLYYQWGDIVGYTAEQVWNDKQFDWGDYKYSIDGSDTNFNKYNSNDGKTVLDLEDDAVYATLGGNWRMPTIDDFQELIDGTTVQITSINGVYGIKLTSKNNNNYIFFPFAGCAYSGAMDYVGSYFSCWSSNLRDLGNYYAFYLYGNSGCNLELGYFDRRYGNSIRGIYNE